MRRFFDPRLTYTVRHIATGRVCAADADWLNTLEDRVFAQWHMDGWVVVEEPCPRCEQVRSERDEAKAMVSR